MGGFTILALEVEVLQEEGLKKIVKAQKFDVVNLKLSSYQIRAQRRKKMAMDLVTVNLTRDNEKEHWGFDLAGGGKDKDVRLYISQIKPGSIAEKVGLKVKDSLVKIGNDCALDYTIEEAMESLKKNKMFFDMIVER